MSSSVINQSNVGLTLSFADLSSRTITIEDVPAQNLMQIKSKVKAVNANVDGAYNALYQSFVSNDGDNFVSISSAKIVSIEEDVIYNG